MPQGEPKIAIAMSWDGRTPTAELIINGATFTGPPRDVERAFGVLNRLRDENSSLIQSTTRVLNALRNCTRQLEIAAGEN